MATPSAEQVAKATFAINNGIEDITADEIYRYDKAAQQAILQQRPWKADPNYFKKVRISAVALIKMVSRPQRGRRREGARADEGDRSCTHALVGRTRSWA